MVRHKYVGQDAQPLTTPSRRLPRIRLTDLPEPILDQIVETAVALVAEQDAFALAEVDLPVGLTRTHAAKQLCLVNKALLPSARRALVRELFVNAESARPIVMFLRFQHPELEGAVRSISYFDDAGTDLRHLIFSEQVLCCSPSVRRLEFVISPTDLEQWVRCETKAFRELRTVESLSVVLTTPDDVPRPVWSFSDIDERWDIVQAQADYMQLVQIFGSSLISLSFRAPPCYDPEELSSYDLPNMPKLVSLKHQAFDSALPAAILLAAGGVRRFEGFPTPQLCAMADEPLRKVTELIVCPSNTADSWIDDGPSRTPEIDWTPFVNVESLSVDVWTEVVIGKVPEGDDELFYASSIYDDIHETLLARKRLPRLKHLTLIDEMKEGEPFDTDWHVVVLEACEQRGIELDIQTRERVDSTVDYVADDEYNAPFGSSTLMRAIEALEGPSDSQEEWEDDEWGGID